MNDLELAAKKHLYRFGTTPFPSVTRITGLLDDQKSFRMAGAAAKIAGAGGNYRAEWKAKADRGTRVHGNIEQWLDGEDAEMLPSDAGFLDAAEKYLTDHPHEWLFMERMVVGNGYGGRLDAIGRDEKQRLALRDWKTGREYDEHVMQLAAYVFGKGLAIYDEEGNFCGAQTMPVIEVASCVYLHEDGTYDAPEHDRNELAEAYEAFRALLDVHTWLQGRKAA